MNLHERAQKYCNHPTASKPAKAIIADLLAENERLNGVVQAQHETMMEAITRTNAAEAQLRELANAEPVAVTDAKATGCILWLGCFPPRDGTYLIRRPEMPS